MQLDPSIIESVQRYRVLRQTIEQAHAKNNLLIEVLFPLPYLSCLDSHTTLKIASLILLNLTNRCQQLEIFAVTDSSVGYIESKCQSLHAAKSATNMHTPGIVTIGSFYHQ